VQPYYYTTRFPWPFEACISACESTSDLADLANRAERGDLGTIDTWLAAEQRWKYNGLTENDILHLEENIWPFGGEIDNIGFPFSCCPPFFSSVTKKTSPAIWNYLWERYSSLPAGKAKSWMAKALLSFFEPIWSRSGLSIPVEPSRLKQIIEISSSDTRYLSLSFNNIALPDVLDQDWIEFFDWLGRQYEFPYFHLDWREQPFKQSLQIVAAYAADTSKGGLLSIMAALVFSGVKLRFPEGRLSLDQVSDEQQRIAIVFIRLGVGQWATDEASILARNIVSSANNPEYLSAIALMMAERHSKKSASFDTFALALYDEMIHSHIVDIGQLIQILNRRIHIRKSKLARKGYWVGLGLSPFE
jgi:hypothetical protein